MTDPVPPGLEPGPSATAPEPPGPSATAPEPPGLSAAAPEPPGPSATAPPEGAAPELPLPDAMPAPDPWPSVSPATPVRGGGSRGLAVLGFLGAVILGAVIGATGLAVATGAIGAPAPSATPAPTEAPTAEPTVPPVGNAIGRPDALVTIEVWADYQCPYCQLEYLLFSGALDREYVVPGIARVVYRDFAFLGQESTDAAVAARCAGAQDPAAQLRYHDILFTYQQGENQGRFARANLVEIAKIAGIPSQAAFTACLDDPAVAAAVADETTAGRNVGVTSTPTLRLRGPGGERVLTGFSQGWPTLREALEAVRVPAPPSPSPSGSPGPSSPASPSPAP